MKRRLLAVTALVVLALAQIVPASATTDYMSYGGSSATGQSTSASVSSAWTERTGGAHWIRLNMWYYDPVSGSYLNGGYLNGWDWFYYDSVGWNTSLNSYHGLGNPSDYDPGFTYS